MISTTTSEALQIQIEQFIRTDCGLIPDQPILIGVSGGADSICLLDILYKLKFPLIVAHLNHQIRDSSTADSQYVRDLANKLGLPVVIKELDVAKFSMERGLSIEEAARILRYHFLFRQARNNDAQAVVVGHTADDQIETFLLHLIRGAGLPGLSGMSPRTINPNWDGDIPLVRPLLKTWREEVLGYCKDRELQYLLDQTNLDASLFRNRLRMELIPFLETYNPQFREIVIRTVDLLSGDQKVLQKIVDDAWKNTISLEGEKFIRFARSQVLAHPKGIQRRILRKAIGHLLPGLRDVDYRTVERAFNLVQEKGTNKQCELTKGFKLFVEGEYLWIAEDLQYLPCSEWPQLPGKTGFQLNLPGTLTLLNGWILSIEVIPNWGGQLGEDDPFQAYIDRDSIGEPIEIRPRKSGERFRPFRLKGHSIKLSNFMINEKMPRRARECWPLICSNDEIVWVPGYGQGYRFRIQDNTKSVVRFRLKKLDG